ncbi:MAG: hypothetical protein GWQ08_03415 [Verrucomicrobiaceae bacterium]|nr:hypothetical protein [Verrucomicrobiaceae bacterium]
MKDVGNTVSSSTPLAWTDLNSSGRLLPGQKQMQVGFGVGYS